MRSARRFRLEGLPCIALGVITFFFLADEPAQARWLSSDDQAMLAGETPIPSLRLCPHARTLDELRAASEAGSRVAGQVDSQVA